MAKMSKMAVALFGANGQIGNRILHALDAYPEQFFNVSAFIRPQTSLKIKRKNAEITVYRVDLTQVDAESLSSMLRGVEVVISAVGSTVLPYQHIIQDAAAKANVRRFFPSEFGMHQVLYLKSEEIGMIHPIWDLKMRCLEATLKHPAVREGRMTYTVIGNSDNFDAAKEPILCPWLDVKANEYTIHAVGDAAAKMDYTSIQDVVAYLVEAILHPELSENRILSFKGDFISFEEVARLLRKHSRKKVNINLISWETAEFVIRNPSSAPSSLAGGSSFPVDFWIALRHVQGQGRMWRPRGQTHNHLFPNVMVHTVDEYFSKLFGNKLAKL